MACAACTPASAQELPASVGDARLPTREGLRLWLDPSREDAARAALELPPLASSTVAGAGVAIGVLHDLAGGGRRFLQRAREAQPRLIRGGGSAALSFDGVDDCLELAGGGAPLAELTLFVHAAPRSNAAGFRALCALNATARNDYTSGLTLDLHAAATRRLEAVNVEGAGFEGAVDLFDRDLEFGAFHTFTVRARAGPGGVELFVDGAAARRRDRRAVAISADEMTLGARFYSNTAEPPCRTGFLDGAIAEVLLFERALSDEERASVERYLAGKHAGLDRALAAAAPRHRAAPLQTPKDPPPVQMLLPGFVVRELPVELPNVNNVRCRHDGKLVALGYDGNVRLLSDRDGDGLPETVETFFENHGSLRAPVGMALTPADDPRGNGVYVAAKGKCVLLLDADRDDRAEKEIVVADGWPELNHGVDALGVAVAQDGRVYFGLGAADYTNPYLLDEKGRARFDLASERGTVLEVAPDFKSRRIFCTGVRFTVGLAFHDGDLFATDQEGATWLANGNPFDELLHLQRGRHYGFPPRHELHLPSVIDEPSVFDYAPQHQSTCGLFFDDAAPGGRAFGPESFHGAALITGYSRGSLFCTRLARAASGWIAQNRTLARTSMLPCDCCVAQDGALVLACHGGSPDWGSGPTGAGRLFQIRFDASVPQPVASWSDSASELCVAFDRPLDPRALAGLAQRARVVCGRYVSAGDRFESQRPGYEAVHAQLASPREELAILSTQLDPSRRVLSLLHEPEPRALKLVAEMPDFCGSVASAPRDALPQAPAIDLAFDRCGVAAQWHAADGGETIQCWLPHVELAVARAFTRQSAPQEELFARLERPGALSLSTRLDLKDVLRPKVQPGSTLDRVLPPEQVTVVLRSATRIQRARADGGELAIVASRVGSSGGGWSTEFTPRTPTSDGVPLEVEIATGGAPALEISMHTAEDSRRRALPLQRFLLPWSRAIDADANATAAAPSVADGRWLRGRAVFFGGEALCSRCHRIRGEGGRIGPDLSNLPQRDEDSVRRDVLLPNATLHPDFLTQLVRLTDGRELLGVPRRDGDRLVVGEAGGVEESIAPSLVAEMVPQPISIMPAGLKNVLSERQIDDLLTFLRAAPLAPAPIEAPDPPAPRSRAEVAQAIARSRERAGDAKTTSGDPLLPAPPIRIVLCSGEKDHGPGEHDYPLFQRRWRELLAYAEGVTVETAQEWPSSEQLARADLIVFYCANPAWSAARGRELDEVLERGGGLAFLHFAVNGRGDVDALAQRIGLSWRDGASRFRHGPVDLLFEDRDHPIARGVERATFVDESYWELVGDRARVQVLASSLEEGARRPQLFVREVGRGRVFVSLLGHYTWTFDDPMFRLLLLRGFAWASHQPVDRLEELVEVGARVDPSPAPSR